MSGLLVRKQCTIPTVKITERSDNLEGKINIHRMLEVMSEILSEKYGVTIKLTAIPKEAGNGSIEYISKSDT